MDENKIITSFPVTVYGNLEKYNNTISKGRCRIFYKGCNRNGTFISDEFADKLLSTIAYAPVKGIYSEENEDFTDHGVSRDLGRIYGIVPAEPNVQWEDHEDEDGVVRTYATVDVLLYTALYAEANQIIGKAQSMELWRDSIQGEWKYIDGKKYYSYTEGCFLGLQTLGDEVEPCFEGAAFFSIYKSLKDLVETIENNVTFQTNGQGGTNMPSLNFRLSDDQKYQALWSLINSAWNEEGNWTIDYDICAIYDDYAVVRKCCENTYERVYYTKDESNDSVILGERKRCYIIDVDDEEKEVLDFLRKKCGGCSTLAEVEEQFAKYENLENQISEQSSKIDECNNTIATLSVERDTANEQLNALNEQLTEANTKYSANENALAAVIAERDALLSYKKSVEDANKMAIINSYADQLPVSVIESYTANLEACNVEDLDMKLTYEVKKLHPEVFTKTPVPQYVPKDEPKSGIESILAKYEKH